MLVEASASYLIRQFEAGVDAVQIFDTWAGVLPADEFRKLVHRAQRTDRRGGAASAFPGAKIIGFPRGAGTELERYVDERYRSMRSGSIGWSSLALRASRSSSNGRFRAISIRWRCWPAAPRSTVRSMRSSRRFATRPFIFNLGHGILPETPIAHVERLIARVRGVLGEARLSTGTRDRGECMYAWIKAFHIIAVIAWMAGMLYLPRLFVYHCAAEPGSVQSETFKVMERRLLRAIINPAMVATWVLGLWLAWLGPDSRYGWFASGWLQAKIVLVWRCRRCTDCSPAG